MNANALAAPFKQLVERRLWPLAILLVAALVAVPMLLAKEPEAPVPAPTAAAPADETAALATQPIVTVGDDAAREARRKVLGARKNPFKPQIRAKKPEAPKTQAAAAPKTADKPASSGGGSTTSPGSAPAVTPPAAIPTPEPKVYETRSLFVRWGETSSGDLRTMNVKRLKAFPAAEFPVVIYMGLLEDHKTAVFLVDHDVKVQGDGKCLPSPDDCQTLHMKRGQISFLDVTSENQELQFQLEVRKIVRSTSTSPTAYKSEAKGGRDALRARVSRLGGLKYDVRTGVLRKER
jgi:hypothetical protein